MVGLSFIQDSILVLFIVSSFLLARKSRGLRFGVNVYRKDYTGTKLINDGRDGIQTLFGKNKDCDVRLANVGGVHNYHFVAFYNAKKKIIEKRLLGENRFISTGENSFRFSGDETEYILEKRDPMYCFAGGFFTTVFAVLFIMSQAYRAYLLHDTERVLIPFVLLIAFCIGATFLRSDKQPIIECSMAVLLTFYFESMTYTGLGTMGEITSLKDVLGLVQDYREIAGILIYLGMFILIRMCFKNEGLDPNYQSLIRFIAVCFVFIFIGVHLIFGETKEESDTMLNAVIGGIKFQPAEIVKLFLIIAIAEPLTKTRVSSSNIAMLLGISKKEKLTYWIEKIRPYFFSMILPGIVAVYGMVINDIGFLLQILVIVGVATIIQENKLRYLLIYAFAGIFGVKLILQKSVTASSRVGSWMGVPDLYERLNSGDRLLSILKDVDFFEAFSGQAIFSDTGDAGWQVFNAATAAFENAGLFGNPDYNYLTDNMSDEAVSLMTNDSVMATVAQTHGTVMLFLVVAVFVVVMYAAFASVNQKTIYQRKLACIGSAVLTVAALCNIGGSMGVLPFTGVVLGAISSGLSSGIAYGGIFALLSASGLSKAHLQDMRKYVNVDDVVTVIKEDSISLREKIKEIASILGNAMKSNARILAEGILGEDFLEKFSEKVDKVKSDATDIRDTTEKGITDKIAELEEIKGRHSVKRFFRDVQNEINKAVKGTDEEAHTALDTDEESYEVNEAAEYEYEDVAHTEEPDDMTEGAESEFEGDEDTQEAYEEPSAESDEAAVESLEEEPQEEELQDEEAQPEETQQTEKDKEDELPGNTNPYNPGGTRVYKS